MEQCLAELSRRGFKLGVCTNKPEAPTETVLRELSIDRFFTVVVGGDTLPVMKPDPAPLKLCLDRLGVSASETLYVGDSEIDRETARAAGVAFALHTGGYGKFPPGDARRCTVFDSFETLLSLPGITRPNRRGRG